MNISSFTSYNQGADPNVTKLTQKAVRWAKNKAGFGKQAKLEKAVIGICNENGRIVNSIKVQFNPSEYSVSRSIHVADNVPFGREAKPMHLQPTKGGFAQFSTTLYFDTISELQSYHAGDIGLPSGAKAAFNTAKNIYTADHNADVREVCKEFTELIKYAREQHRPRTVVFSWGTFSFRGYIVSCNQTFTMFYGDGTPVRAKMTITIKGEETDVIQKTQGKPFESPDRTKKRTLVEGDQLWMLAYNEYSDPSMWKAIARENGILNPRTVRAATDLKLPAMP